MALARRIAYSSRMTQPRRPIGAGDHVFLVIADLAGVIAGDLREGKFFAKNISRDLLHDVELCERTSCIDFLPMTTSKFMCPLPKGKKPPRGVWRNKKCQSYINSRAELIAP